MKAAPFAYVRPTRLADVVAELVAADEQGGGKVIAGGQSLVPVLAMRLGRPGTLVDITQVPELGQVGVSDGVLRIGAAVRQRRIEREYRGTVPLLSQALPWIGHREIRSRGTVCGSLAHADPSSELPAVALCLGATLDVAGPDGRRQVAADDFFVGAMTTALGPTDVVTSVRMPLPGRGEGFGFSEVARRHGDFALAGVGVRVRIRDGEIRDAHVTSFGVSDRPQRRDLGPALAEAITRSDGSATDLASRLTEATDAMAADVVTTGGDSSGSPAYRRRLVRTLAARELARAYTSTLRSVAA
ncbi:FAD binding domain-containing protein [Georgenia sp. Z1344]|uniref:FAD binding domain-containing protein n=1 Tax=Georgenia sp. Z1344 TaxID=3416706 RepID=UPI003CF01E21